MPNNPNLKLPLLITVTGPSGTGKDSVINILMNHLPTLRRYPSCTTRKIRAHEKDGEDYFFVTEQQFEEFWQQDDLLERSNHYNNHYGIRRSVIQSLLKQNLMPIKDMTFSGTQACKKAWPANTFRIALLPPSRERLFQRLTKRDPNLSEEGKARFKLIAEDLDHTHNPHYVFTNPDMKGSTLADYDAVFVNDDLEVTTYAIAKLLKEEQQRRS